MARATFYNQRSHSIIVAGTALEDFYEGESITFQPEGDDVTATRGLDRNELSQGSPRPATLTVMLKPTSPSIDFLDTLIRDIRAGARGKFNLLYQDGANQYVESDSALVQKQERSSGGPTMQAYIYIFTLANYEERL